MTLHVYMYLRLTIYRNDLYFNQAHSSHDDVLSDTEEQVPCDDQQEEQVLLDDTDGEYEEEEAVSRTINEELSPATLDDVSNQEFGSFHGKL